MIYRNIRNGAVIDIPSILLDQNWEAVKDQPSGEEKPKKAVTSNGRKRKLRDSK